MDAVSLNKAADLLRQARRLDPERLETHERLAEVLPLLSTAEATGGRRVSKRLREESRDVLLWLSRYHQEERDLVRAKSRLEALLELQGEDLEIRRRLIQLDLEGGAGRGAANSLADLAGRHRAEGQAAQAQELLEEALEIDPTRTDLRRALIEMHQEIGTGEKAFEESFSLVETLLTQGKGEEARGECRRLQRTAKGNTVYLERLAQLSTRLNDTASAYSLYLELAHQENRSQQTERAIEFAAQAQRSSPDEETPYELLTDLYLQAEQRESAVEQLRELAALRRRKRSTTKLIATLLRLIAIDGKDVTAREELVQCLNQVGDPDVLLGERVALAHLYEELERFEDALAQYQQILEKNPFNLDLIGEAGKIQMKVMGEDAALDFYLERAQTLDRLGARPEAEQLIPAKQQL